MTPRRPASTSRGRYPASTRRRSPAAEAVTMNRPMRPARNAEVTGAMVAACIRRWDSMAVNWRAPSTSETGPGLSTVTAMAKPMNTAGTPTSSTHRTRLRRYSRTPARSTATSRAVTDAVPAADGVIDLVAASGATTRAAAARWGAGAMIGAIGGARMATTPLVEDADAGGRDVGRVVAVRRATARATRPNAQSSDQPTSPRGPA